MCSGRWNFSLGSPNWPDDRPASSHVGAVGTTAPNLLPSHRSKPLLRFDRERFWFEFHRAGFTLADLVQVVRYLQKEIRHAAATSAPSNYPISSNWTASRRTSTSAACVSWPNCHARKHPPISARLLCGRPGTRAPARPGTTAPTQSKTLSRTALNWRGNFGFTQISAQPSPVLSRYARSTSP